MPVNKTGDVSVPSPETLIPQVRGWASASEAVSAQGFLRLQATCRSHFEKQETGLKGKI